MKTLCVLLAIVVVAAGPALAERPEGAPPTVDDESDVARQFKSGLNPVDRGQVEFVGTVYDQGREPIPGVDVKLFVDGLLAEKHRTDSVGQYQFKTTIDFTRDETVLLWFVDPTLTLAPKAFVIKESSLSKDERLLSPCLTRLQLEPTIESTIYLLDHDAKSKQLSHRECL